MTSRIGIALLVLVPVATLISIGPLRAEETVAASGVASEVAPAAFAVRLETTKGVVVIEAYRPWAPLAVDRFYNLVRSGYLDGNLFFRVEPKEGVDFGLHGDPKTREPWAAAPIRCDPPRRGIRAGDVFLLNDGTGERAATELRIQTGDDASMASRSGAAALGRVVEGTAVLATLDASHMKDLRKWRTMVRHLLNDGEAEARKDFPAIDSIVKASLLDRSVEIPAEPPPPAAAATIPPGMALVRVYRPDTSVQKFTLRVDGAARAVMTKGSVFEVTLPAGPHELSSKVKFKMFATGLADQLFAARDTLAVDLAAGGEYHVRAVPIGDSRTLALYFVGNDFGAEESKALSAAKLLQGTEEEE